MAAENFGTKGTIQRGANPQLPSGTEKDPIAVAVQSISDGIIDALQKSLEETLGENKEADVAIETAVNSVTTALVGKDVNVNVISAIQTLEETIKDRFAAVLMAMYGTKQANPQAMYQRYSGWIKQVGQQGFTKNGSAYAIYDLMATMYSEIDEIIKEIAGGGSKKKSGGGSSENINLIISAGKGVSPELLEQFTMMMMYLGDGTIKANALTNAIGIFTDLGNISKIIDKNFSDKTVETLQYIIEFLGDKEGNNGLTAVLKALESNCDECEQMQSRNALDSISNMLGAICSLQGFNKKSYKSMVYGLKKLIYLTAEPGFLGKTFGIGDKGLIYKLINNIVAASAAAAKTIPVTDNISNLFKTICTISTRLDLESIEELSEKINIVASVFDPGHSVTKKKSGVEVTKDGVGRGSMATLFDTVGNFYDTYLSGDTGAKVGLAIDTSNEILAQFKNLGKPLKTKDLFLLSMVKLPLSVMICGSLITFFGKLGNAATAAKNSMEHLKTIKEVIDSFSGVQLLKMRSLAEFVNALQKINKLLAVNGTIGKLAIGGLQLIKKELSILGSVVGDINKIKVGKESIDKIKAIGKLIVMCSAVMIIGGMLTVFMLPVMLGSLVFTACLTAFVWGVVVGLSKAMAKADMVALNTFVEGLVPMVALCSIIMLLGGYVLSKNPKIAVGVLGFLVLLLGFVWGLVFGLDKIFSSKIGDKFTGENPQMLEYARNFKNVVKELTIMLGIAALGAIPGIPALIFAGLLYVFVKITVPILGIISGKVKVDGQLVDPQKSLLQLSLFAGAIQRLGTIMILGGLFVIPAALGLVFGCMLKYFIKLQLQAFSILLNNDEVKDWKQFEKTLNQFTKAVILLGAVMLIGGTLFTVFPALIMGSLIFCGIMIAFVSIMLLVFGLTSRITKSDRANVMGFGELVALSGLTMVIGAMFMWIPGLWKNALLFGVILAAFLALVLTGIALGTKMMTRGLKNKAKDIARLVILMGAIMLIGAAFMYIPGLAVNALIFTGILAVFLGAFVGIMFLISEIQKHTNKKVYLVIAGILVIIVVMGLVMKLLADITNQTKGLDLLGTVGIMALVLAGMIVIVIGVALLIHALDPIGGVGAIAAAEAVIAGVVAIIWLLAEAFKNIAAANNALAEMKEIDTKKFGKTILAFGEVAFAVATCALANPLLIAGITTVAYNSLLMAGTIYVISNAVKDAAELSIATYDENGKVKGRRNLNEKDFTNAANNVKTIISVLGNAIIETYNKNPQIFEWDFFGRTPFGMVCKSCGKLGPMISKIAEGVKEYADMRITTYDENGKKKGSRPLTDADFKAAARNISTIISVLGDTVIQTYEKNPEMFAEPLIGQNQFTYVVRSCGRLGPMISKIAEGVKDYADLRIAIFDEKGQQTGSRNMTDADFKAAANNISFIITTLGGTVMKVYNKNPEMFAEPLIGQNQFTYVVRSCGRLGEMISKIAEGIKDYADLRIAIFDEKGQQTGSRNMTDADFQTASDNISLIITTLGGTVMKVYKKNPEMFETSWYESNDSSPFNMVVNSCAKLGEMISNIGKGVKDFANLTMNIYDDKGQVTGVRNMEEADFNMATSNITRIITLLGNTIISAYKENPDIFEDGEDSMFAQAAASFGTLGEMVSNIASGIKDYADLRIDIYDDEGKVIGNRPMDEKDFESATNNIGTIITTLGASIISAYKENPDIFEDGEDSDFAAVAASYGTMGKMVADISSGIKNYADLRIDVYDDDGKEIIGTRPMDEKDFEKAATNIGKIITILGKTIVDEYNKPENEDIFDDGEDSDFANVCKACTTMGSMISTIATSIKEYANMTIDIYDDNGNVIGKKTMGSNEFTDAADTISNIITTIGSAIITTYGQYPQLFEGEGDDTVFAKVRKSMQGTGKLVSDGAIGIATVMNLGVEVSDANREAIAKKVGLILTILSESIQSVAYTDWNWETRKGTKINPAFDDAALLDYKGLKVGNKGGTSPVAKVVQSMSGAGALVTEGVFAILSLLALPKFDPEVVKQKAATAVYCVVGSIADTYEAHPGTFDDPGWFTNDDSKSGVNKVKRAMKGAAALVVEAADAASKVSALNVDWHKLAWRTTKIIAAIPQAIMNATLNNPNKELKEFWEKEANNDKGKFALITNKLNSTAGLIDNIIDIYTQIGKMTTGDAALNIDLISAYLNKMIQKIPSEIKKAGDIISDETNNIEGVINIYTACNTVIDDIIGTYKKANSAFKSLGAIKDASIIESIGTNIGIMISAIPKSLSGLDDGKGFNPLAFAKISAFINSYSENIANLSNTFSMVPSDMSGRTGLISMLAGVNEQIKNTPDLTNFTNETQQLGSFVKSVNSINTFKLNSLTTLANALTTMSSKLGSLEKLTDVLANKVAVVLSHLTKRLDQSATTIKVAEKIQNERHKKITEALTQLKKLMSEPLNVSVTHKQEPMDQTTLSNAGTSTTDTQQGGGSTNVGTGDTTTAPASPSTPASNNSNKPKTQSKENKPNYLTGDSGNAVTLTNFSSLWQNEYKQHHAKSNSGGGGRTGANK